MAGGQNMVSAKVSVNSAIAYFYKKSVTKRALQQVLVMMEGFW